ncbi:hypothetical protein K435DRAFT_811000 [Dendrothele bispora CBS 962.96]|uniref:Ubiquitin-like protease family profile domain-containing protein n=1 Tax=Dendrothele bispora (strain CBS 962.96) TaxID=1314807 RepID=A0A4S8KTC0_DENBC|nr:hypothetical protein K435DRAFT_811000 [Dendrothele bispora CBS 962.96]
MVSMLAQIMPNYKLNDAQKMSLNETNNLFIDKLSSYTSPGSSLTMRNYKKLVQLHRSILQVLDCLMQLPILFSALKDLSRHHCLGETGLHHALRNLSQIQQVLRNEGDRLKTVLWELTEESKENATLILNHLLVKAASQNLNFQHHFEFLRLSDLQTLSPTHWLNGEIINYFIDKWCRSSDTLGLGTYWANTFLFQDKACTKPLDKFDNNSKIVNDLKRSIRRRERDLDNLRWSKIYIPINNAKEGHWYCASIDFDQHTIEILDSWGPTFLTNQNRPLRQKKHTALLAVLMWITERVAEYRGETVVLARNPNTDWSCNPHAEVPLQPNGYDCGIHMLWHLYHIVNFGSIKRNNLPAEYRFTESMILSFQIYICVFKLVTRSKAGGKTESPSPSPEKKPARKSASSKAPILGDAFAFIPRGVGNSLPKRQASVSPSTESRKKVPSDVVDTRIGKSKQVSNTKLPERGPLTSNDYVTTLEQRAKKTNAEKDSSSTDKSKSKFYKRNNGTGNLDDDEETMINAFHSSTSKKPMKQSGVGSERKPLNGLDEYDNEDHMVKMVDSDNDSEGEEGEENSSVDDSDIDSQEEDRMVVEEVNVKKPVVKRAKKGKTKISQKVLLGSFSRAHRKLADYGKDIVRMATCLGGLFPEDRDECWGHVRTAVKQSGDEAMLAALKSVERDEPTRKRMTRYVGYAVGAVRLHLKNICKEMIIVFFGLSGDDHEQTLALLGWLQGGKKGGRRPFHFGDLELKILRIFLYSSLSRGDQPLLAYLKKLNQVPIHLVATVVTMISHVLSEQASANYNKGSKLDFSKDNSGAEYLSILKGLQEMEKNSPEYTRIVTKNIWYHVQKNDCAIPAEVYDYNHLEAIAAGMVEYNFVEDDDEGMGAGEEKGMGAGEEEGEGEGEEEGKGEEGKGEEGKGEEGKGEEGKEEEEKGTGEEEEEDMDVEEENKNKNKKSIKTTGKGKGKRPHVDEETEEDDDDNMDVEDKKRTKTTGKAKEKGPSVVKKGSKSGKKK